MGCIRNLFSLFRFKVSLISFHEAFRSSAHSLVVHGVGRIAKETKERFNVRLKFLSPTVTNIKA